MPAKKQSEPEGPGVADLMETLNQIAEIIRPHDNESIVDAVKRVVTDLTQGAKDAGRAHIPAGAGSIPAPATMSAGVPSSVPDDDPTDPRPAFEPELGWRTPAVIEWAHRQVARRNNAHLN